MRSNQQPALSSERSRLSIKNAKKTKKGTFIDNTILKFVILLSRMLQRSKAINDGAPARDDRLDRLASLKGFTSATTDNRRLHWTRSSNVRTPASNWRPAATTWPTMSRADLDVTPAAVRKARSRVLHPLRAEIGNLIA
jgi:hypothetical protein